MTFVDDDIQEALAQRALVRDGGKPSFSYALEVVLDMAGQQLPDMRGEPNLAPSHIQMVDEDHTMLCDLLSNFADEIDDIANMTPLHAAPQPGVRAPSERLKQMLDLAVLGVNDDPDMGEEIRFQEACISRVRELMTEHGANLDSAVRVVPTSKLFRGRNPKNSQ